MIKINDLFVVKYNVSEQNFLERHTDGSVYSFNILLNERVDFDGGGTGIYAPWNYEECHISKGDLVIHPGFLNRGHPRSKRLRAVESCESWRRWEARVRTYAAWARSTKSTSARHGNQQVRTRQLARRAQRSTILKTKRGLTGRKNKRKERKNNSIFWPLK